MKNLNTKIPQVGIFLVNKIDLNEAKKITTAQQAADVFKAIEDFNKTIDCYEQFYTIYLNQNSKILSVCCIGSGGETSCTVSVQKIAQGAILQNAQGIILSHNHPSGNLAPSDQDKKLTRQIVSAMELFNIKVLDHLIITSDNYYSFSNNGII